MSTMNVVRIESFGGPNVLKLQKLPIPRPRNDELLVRVHAAGVSPVDYKTREGKYPAVKADRLPYVLGREISGTVEVPGPGARGWRAGDAIYAMLGLGRGGYAERVIVELVEAAHRPKSLDHVAAAGVPLAGLTAWQGLFRHGGLSMGQRVLIHGGAGGVGHFAIQLAKARGAFVITTVSEKRMGFARELGADQVIDYKKLRFEQVVKGVDMVFDLIGGETQSRSWDVLRRGGILVSTLTEPPAVQAQARGVRAMRFTVQENGAELEEIGRLIDAGKVRPRISRTFALNDVIAAQQHLEEGHTEGKVVLAIAA